MQVSGAHATSTEPVLLAERTTIRLGGPAGEFVQATDEAQLCTAIAEADAAGTPVLVLGGGSNLVVADAGFAGRVVHVEVRGLRFEQAPAGIVVLVAAGEPWDDVVRATVAEGFAGLECLSGIPGLAGATPIQNVGAYGAEIADVLTGVRVYDRASGQVDRLDRSDLRFGYRTSALKRQHRFVVLGIELALRRTSGAAPIGYRQLAEALGVPVGTSGVDTEAVRAAVLALRAAKGMLVDPADPDSVSVGSFFLNPIVPAGQLPAGAPSWPASEGMVKTPAAWLIERAGFLPGCGDGPVGLSSKHTLALVNRGGATTEALLAFARTIRDRVLDRFAIALEPEPTLVGVRF